MVNINVKRYFFDRKVVIDAIGRVKAQNFAKAGAFIQRRARSLLRRRKRPSQPGQPPSVHAPSGQYASLKTIFFAWDPGTQTTVIGPVGLNQVENVNAVIVSGAVPALHEFGGTARIMEKRRKGSNVWQRRDRRRALRHWEETRTRVARYMPRPFMGPALEAERQAGTLVNVWKDSVKGAA